MKTKILISCMLIPLLAVGVSSCNKDNQKNTNPPDLPPIEAMSLPMNGFTTKSLISNQETYTWFTVSAVTVGVWSGAIGLTMAVPVASFAEAYNQERIQVSENLWRWTYDVNVLTDVYKAELEASLNGELVVWEMYISKTGTGSFSRFKWFTGISLPDGTNGSWVMYKSPVANDSLYEIVWHKDIKAGTSDITYTNVSNSDINKNSYIKLEKTTESLYDATYTIYGSIDNKTIAIKWNSTTTEGNITISKDGAIDGPHCWDLAKSDLLICPN